MAIRWSSVRGPARTCRQARGKNRRLQCFNELLRKGAATETLAVLHLGQVGLLILRSLLEQLEDSFRFGLPIEKMEQLLRERAKTEPALG